MLEFFGVVYKLIAHAFSWVTQGVNIIVKGSTAFIGMINVLPAALAGLCILMFFVSLVALILGRIK